MIPDANAAKATNITSVRAEYAEREYLPGVKWINVAPRPGTSLCNNVGGHRDELHILVIDVDGKITGTTGAVLERFIGAFKASDAKTSVGETNYYKKLSSSVLSISTGVLTRLATLTQLELLLMVTGVWLLIVSSTLLRATTGTQ